MKILLINLNSLGFSGEKFAPTLQSALLLLEKGFKFDVILYNTNLVDCKCCCDITKSLRARFNGLLVAVIDTSAECCLKSREAGADNYISMDKYNKQEVQKILNYSMAMESFRQGVVEYKNARIPALSIK